MRRLALSVIAVAAALVLQLTVVDRLPLPGGGPDLVLLAVVALGLTSGPMAGMLTGFLAGLALDIAPPASGVLGEHALVFCVVGYGCGRLSGLTDRSAASSLGVAAVAAAAGEMLYVAVGLTIGDPGISWSAIRSVLPSSVLQDVLISPFVVFGIWKASSPAAGYSLGPAAGAAAAGLRAGLAGPGPGRLASGAVLPARAGLLGRASWLAGPLGSGRGQKASPVGSVGSVRFGKSAARQGDGWVGSGPRASRPAQAQVRRGRRPRLRPGAGQAGSAAMVQLHRRQRARPVSVRMSHRRRGDGSIGAGLLAAAPGRRNPRGAAVRPARQPRFRSGSGSLGGQSGRTGPGGARPGGAGLGGARLGGAGPRGAGFSGRGLGGAGLGGRGLGGTGFRNAGQGRKGLGRTRLGRKGVGRKGVGGTTLGRAGLGGSPPDSSMPGSSLSAGGTTRRGAVASSVSLHLRGGRRGDGVVGGGSPRRPASIGPAGTRPRKQPRFFRRRPRLSGRRPRPAGRGPSFARRGPSFARRGPSFARRQPSLPRGRPRPAGRGPSFARRQLSLPRRRPRLRSGRPSFLASRASGKAAGRRLAWRADGRTGGFR